MARFCLIVFDLDGTLVDSRRDLTNAANELLAACGGDPLSEDVVATMIGEGARVLVERAFAAASLPRPADALARFLAVYERHLLVHTRAYAGMPRVLDELRRDARLAVLTNKPTTLSVRLLEGLGLAQHFAEVVGGDGAYGRKPDPSGLAALMGRAGATPDATLMVGDSAIDLQTARGAGSAICLARYGFSYWTVKDRLTGGEHLIDAPADLLLVAGRVRGSREPPQSHGGTEH